MPIYGSYNFDKWVYHMTHKLCGTTPYMGISRDFIPGIENMPNVRDHDLSVYLRLQGNGLSIGGYEPWPDMLPQVI